jgi:hypothetical protein
MKSFVAAAVVGILALMATSNPLAAQGVWIGGGATFPTSDYGEVANTGYLLTAGVGTSVGSGGLSVGVEGFYGQNSTDTDGNKFNPYGFFGQVSYDLGGADAERGIYVLGQLGMAWDKFSSETLPALDGSDSGFAYGGAVGYFLPLGGVNGWVEGKFTQASISGSNIQWFGILAGISIPFGG